MWHTLPQFLVNTNDIKDWKEMQHGVIIGQPEIFGKSHVACVQRKADFVQQTVVIGLQIYSYIHKTVI